MLARLKFNIHALVNEILDQIPQDLIIEGRILDPAIGGGQFVAEVERRKRAAGKTDSDIRDSVFGFEDNILRMNYAVNKNGLVGNYQVGSFLQQDLNGMKFDVVIGNPPYDLTNSKKVWPDFIKKSLNMINPNGYVAMVCPSTWLTSNGSVYKNIRSTLTSNHDVQLISRDANDHFNVGINICYWISQSRPYQHQVQYTENETTTTLDLRNGIPKSPHENFIDDLINKIISFGPGIPWIINDKGSNLVSKSEISTDKNDTHRYKVYQTSNRIGYINRKLPDYGKLKLAVNFSSAYYGMNSDDCNMPIVSENIGSLMGYHLVSSIEEGEKLRSYLTSKVIRFLVANYKKKNTGFSDAVKRRIIPLVPIKYWTDPEVYNLFNLTSDEITYIESIVK